VGRVKSGQSVTFSVTPIRTAPSTAPCRIVRLGAQTVQNVVTYTAIIGVDNDDDGAAAGHDREPPDRHRRAPERVARARTRPCASARPRAWRSRRRRWAPHGACGRGTRTGRRSLPARGARARTSNSLRDRITEEVRPTPEQAAALDRIFAEARENRPRREPGVSDEERRASLRQARQDMHRRIAAALDPERRARFEAMTAEGRRGGRAEAAADAATPGRVYVLDANGRPQAVAVRLGITDGSTTELVAGDLAEGAALVVGGGPRGPAAQPVEPGTPSPAQRSRGQRLF
jgi:HlyD family secretion protein